MKKIIWWVSGLILIAGLLVFVLNRGACRIPAKLNGMWVTTAVDYTDRYLFFQDESLVFGTGGNTRDYYHVNRVREEDNGPEIHYIIDYENDQKAKHKLKFVFTQGHNETIKVSHLDDILWTRKK